MADASLSQHVDTGLGAVTNCKADVYGPQVGYGVHDCLDTGQETQTLRRHFGIILTAILQACIQHCCVSKTCMAAQLGMSQFPVHWELSVSTGVFLYDIKLVMHTDALQPSLPVLACALSCRAFSILATQWHASCA